MSDNKGSCKNQKQRRGLVRAHQQKTITLTVAEGQVAFRLLCSIYAAGGVIGHSGSVVKRLERDTSARIHVDDPVSSSSKERIVHVIGSVSVDRRFRFHDHGENVDVSAAQEGLLRVFERVLEVEPVTEGGVVRCRLLVGAGMAGAVIGEGGQRINKITKETGAFIKILTQDSLPPCADSSDELIQITGGSLPVRKALVVISQYLQQKASQVVRANGATPTAVLQPSMDMETKEVGVSGTLNEVVTTEVVFRLLCPCDAAGAVIGWKGRKIKALEEETGASIFFSAPEAGCNERVITVSAFENRDSNHSFAQNAVLRVFNESTSLGTRRAVAARLLVRPNEAGWLQFGGSSKISAIQKATGAEFQMLEHYFAPTGASSNERIIQIHGECSSVLIALFQVTWRLREIMFGDTVGRDNAPLLPHELFNMCPYVEGTATLTARMNNCRVSEEVNGSLPHKFSQFPNGHCSPTDVDNPRDLAINNGFELGSVNKSIVVTNTKVELAIREDVFGAVYGHNGSNLARLRLISGATVEVQDPSPGSEGKVILSGTPDQTLAAQSLLQAFMMEPQ